jgi:hypothetical protein
MSEFLIPFKIKKYLCNKNIFKLAIHRFGKPLLYSHDFPDSYKLTWFFYTSFVEASLEIKYTLNKDHFDSINLEMNCFKDFDEDLYVGKQLTENYNYLIDNFIREIRKPWEDWTEDEILESPQWVYLFYSSNGRTTPAMHSAMILGDSRNEYVKEYFKLWKSQNKI